MADYCGFRARELRSTAPADTAQLDTMLRFNVAEEFGVELETGFRMPQDGIPVFVDGRMLPHEWIRRNRSPKGEARFVKCDAASHGDDHFFPGPATDIAWDIAGTIVEWDMSDDACAAFLERYQRTSGDDAPTRLTPFLLAYSVFRMAYCRMAASAMQGSEEEPRLLAAYHCYRAHASRHLSVLVPSATLREPETIAA
jgi:hypothetical protein